MVSSSHFLRILFATAECAPFAQSGGLGEVAAKLPRALARAGHDVRIVLPWYGFLDADRFAIRPVVRARIPYEGDSTWVSVGRTDLLGLPVYLVGHPQHTKQMYRGKRDKYGWIEEHPRFWFFAAATAAVFGSARWQPDVIHLNDYHSSLIPTFLGPNRPPVVLTIHNAHYQGGFSDPNALPPRLRDRDDRPLPALASPRARFVNFLRRGVRTADLVVAVSPTFARELVDPHHYDGLGDLLHDDNLIGITNGIDTELLDPARDRTLASRYGSTTLERRVGNKRRLQRLLDLPVSTTTPLLAMIARLDPQKGIDLVLRLLEPLATRGVQLAITGDGGPLMRDILEELAAAAPGFLSYRRFDRELESLYYGAADLVLVPSRYEPCGLVQLKALRYGAVPIVQRVGGLADTVQEHDPKRSRGNGFTFNVDDPSHLLAAIDRARAALSRPAEWRALQRRAMSHDVGWEQPAALYVAAYRRAMRAATARRRVAHGSG